MESHPSFGTTVVELDIQWCHMCLKSQPGRCTLSARTIIDSIGLVTNGELRANRNVSILRKILRNPGTEADRIPVIASL